MDSMIVLATSNQGKIREYKNLLNKVGVIPMLMCEDVHVEETGSTFEENAILKAGVYMERSGLSSMSDDSGIEIDALCGRPGIMSARYAGENATNKDLIDKVLKELEGVPIEDRTARFVCVISLINKRGETRTYKGVCNGLITGYPIGDGGFGYDPIFFVPRLHKTMAQLSIDEKNMISHRSRAFEKMVDDIEKMRSEGILEQFLS